MWRVGMAKQEVAHQDPVSLRDHHMTFRESAEDTGMSRGAPGVTMTSSAEEETTEEAGGPEETGGSATREDPVHLYLREIGKIPLLTAEEEVTVGRRIEAGQIALRRALAGVPMAVRALLAASDQLRKGRMAADDLFVLPDGSVLG